MPRVKVFTDLLVFVNYVYNWKIWRHINKAFEQFYCGCGYVPTANKKGKYSWVLDSSHLGRVLSVLDFKGFPAFLEVVVTVP